MAARKAPEKPSKKSAPSPKKPAQSAKGKAPKATAKRALAKGSKPVKGPKEPLTQRQLATIRDVFSGLELSFTEDYDAHTGTSYFTIDTGVGELEDIRVVHIPGVLTLYARFGVRPKEEHRRELERFASQMNAGMHHGCVVLHGSPPQVSFRASVDYASVTDLDRGYVGRLVGDAVSMIQAIDLPLILIAQGKPADAAISEVIEIEEVPFSPQPPKKTVKAKKTKKA